MTDTYYFVHRTLTGDGSITVRVSSLSGRLQGGDGNSASVADMAGAPGPVQPWAKAGLILTAATKPGSAYAAVMLTGAHGVRMQFDYFHDIAGPAASRRTRRAGSPDPFGHDGDGYRIGGRRTWFAGRSVQLAGCPGWFKAGLFVTSPLTAPTEQALVPGAERRGHGRKRHVRRAGPSGWMVARRLDAAGRG